jgi:hypothetical protein
LIPGVRNSLSNTGKGNWRPGMRLVDLPMQN